MQSCVYAYSWFLYRIFFLLGPDQLEDVTESIWRLLWPSILSLTVANSMCLGKKNKMGQWGSIMTCQEYSPSSQQLVVEGLVVFCFRAFHFLIIKVFTFCLCIPPIPASLNTQRRNNLNRKSVIRGLGPQH